MCVVFLCYRKNPDSNFTRDTELLDPGNPDKSQHHLHIIAFATCINNHKTLHNVIHVHLKASD